MFFPEICSDANCVFATIYTVLSVHEIWRLENAPPVRGIFLLFRISKHFLRKLVSGVLFDIFSRIFGLLNIRFVRFVFDRFSNFEIFDTKLIISNHSIKCQVWNFKSTEIPKSQQCYKLQRYCVLSIELKSVKDCKSLSLWSRVVAHVLKESPWFRSSLWLKADVKTSRSL